MRNKVLAMKRMSVDVAVIVVEENAMNVHPESSVRSIGQGITTQPACEFPEQGVQHASRVPKVVALGERKVGRNHCMPCGRFHESGRAMSLVEQRGN